METIIEFTDDRFSKVCWAVIKFFLWGAMVMFWSAAFIGFGALGVVGTLHLIGQLMFG